MKTANGNVYVWGSIEYGQIGIDPNAVESLYTRYLEERNRARMNMLDINNNNGSQSNRMDPHLRDQIEAAQASAIGRNDNSNNTSNETKQDSDNVATAKSLDNEDEMAGIGAIDENDDKKEEPNTEDANGTGNESKEAELTGDDLLRDILSKFSFESGAACVTAPIRLQTLERVKIVKIAAGNSHSMCLDSEGNVWAFGQNEMGQLGLGKYEKPESDEKNADDNGTYTSCLFRVCYFNFSESNDVWFVFLNARFVRFTCSRCGTNACPSARRANAWDIANPSVACCSCGSSFSTVGIKRKWTGQTIIKIYLPSNNNS